MEIKVKNKIFNIFILLLVSFLAAAIIITAGCSASFKKSEDTVNLEKQTAETQLISDEKTQESADTGADKEEILQDDIIDGLDRLLEQGADSSDLIKYIDEYAAAALPKTMTALLEKLEYLQRANENSFLNYLIESDGQEKLYELFYREEDITKDNIARIDDPVLRDGVLRMLEGGFKFVGLEGYYYPLIDFEYLKKYSQYLEKEYINYLEVRAAESNYIYSRDAAIIISWDELAERMMRAEKFLIDYPSETSRKIAVGKLFLGYMASYIYGQDNTRTWDWTTNIVYDEVVESYDKTIAKYQGTTAADILNKLLDDLKSNDFTVDRYFIDIPDKYLKDAIKAYGLDTYYMISEQLKYMYYRSEYAKYGHIELFEGKYSGKYYYDKDKELTVTLSGHIAVGDLDGDNINDAAAIIVPELGNDGPLYYLHAVLNIGFYLYDITDILLGEDIVIKDILIEDEIIIIDMLFPEEGKKLFKLENYELNRIMPDS